MLPNGATEVLSEILKTSRPPLLGLIYVFISWLVKYALFTILYGNGILYGL